MNRPQDFDYNWVQKRHGLRGDFGEVYNQFVTRKLSPRDELSYDGYIEHVFERVVLNLCDNSQIMLNHDEINNIFCPFISTGEFKNYAIQTNNEGPLLNILIRTSGRPNLFSDLLYSIRTQTYSNVQLIIAVDSQHSYNSYIKNNKLIRNNDKVVIIDKDKYSKFGEAYYNMYFNEMYKYINEGWIIHLDDDNILKKQTSLSIITNYMVDTNKMIMWRHNIIGRIIPNNWNIVPANVDTNMICFYHTHIDKLIPWNNSDTSDFDIIKNLEQKTKGVEKIEEILTTINICNRTETRGFGKRNDREFYHHTIPKTIFDITNNLSTITKNEVFIPINRDNFDCYVINLKKRHDRLKHFNDEIAKIDIDTIKNTKRFDAIVGNALNLPINTWDALVVMEIYQVIIN